MNREIVFEVAKAISMSLVGIGMVLMGHAVAMSVMDCPDYAKLYTEDWNEARHFASECEKAGGTVTMRPHWDKYDDKPHAATIICSSARD